MFVLFRFDIRTIDQTMINLIINADDFGYCPRRNRAIFDLFNEHKIVSSTSLLVNGKFSEEIRRFDIPTGLHLNLTEGRPISENIDRIRSLIDENGHFHGKFGLREKLNEGKIDRNHLIHEIESQIERFFFLTDGRPPSHIDGHQHIHVDPLIVEEFSRAARKHNFDKVRLPFDEISVETEPENSFHRLVCRQADSARQVFDRFQLKYADFFFGMTTFGSKMTEENFEKILSLVEKSNRKDLIVEFMCHPGFPSENNVGGCSELGPDEFSTSQQRLTEFQFLSSENLKKLLRKYSVRIWNHSLLD